MSTLLRCLTIVCVLFAAGLKPASAQVPGEVPASATDTTAPLLRTSDLAYAAVFFGSLIAIEPLEGLDSRLSPNTLPTGFTADFADAGDTFGKGYVAYGLGGAALLGGKLFGSSRLSRIGIRAIGALAASDVIVFPAKVIVGRQRPAGGDDTDRFDSFAFEREFYSFPSGHTAHAFALAGAVSDEFADDAPWVRFVAYPIALATGASRLIGQEHWATDVIAGAAAGLFASEISNRLFGGRGTSSGTVGAIQPIFSAGSDGWVVGMSARTR
jgi:membrane-associated phospholipid phosphatase